MLTVLFVGVTNTHNPDAARQLISALATFHTVLPTCIAYIYCL